MLSRVTDAKLDSLIDEVRRMTNHLDSLTDVNRRTNELLEQILERGAVDEEEPSIPRPL